MSTPLRELIARLADDPSTQATFAADPVAFLGDHGWADLDAQDVESALGALVQELPVDHAARLGEAVAAKDSIDGGPAGAVSGLEAIAGRFGEAQPVGDGPLADPALALDTAAVEGSGGNGVDLDDLELDPVVGIDDATGVQHELAAEHDVDSSEHDPDPTEHDVDNRDGLRSLDDDLTADGTPLDEPRLDDPLDALDPADQPDPWADDPPDDDMTTAAAAHEPDLDDGT
jgi:hypothetical protein